MTIIQRSKEWWLRMAKKEIGVASVGAGRLTYTEDLQRAAAALVYAARTSGGTAGRDDYLCSACERVEALLPPRMLDGDPA